MKAPIVVTRMVSVGNGIMNQGLYLLHLQKNALVIAHIQIVVIVSVTLTAR